MQAVAAAGLWAGWGVVLVAVLVPAVATLTVVRMVVGGALALALGGVAIGLIALVAASGNAPRFMHYARMRGVH